MNPSNHEQSILASVASQLCSFKEQNVLSNIRGGSKPLSSFAYTERMLTQSSFAYPERMLTQSSFAYTERMLTQFGLDDEIQER